MSRPRILVATLLLLASSPPLPAAPASSDPLPLYELGAFSHAVTTRSPEAQRYFNQGLAFLYGFNHDEAIRSFRRAAELDPACAMAHWGVAVANGPHINNPGLPADRAQAAFEALTRAQAASAAASPVEKALIGAQAARYAVPPLEDRKQLDLAYANAMRAVWAAYPQDPDVGALFAEALADLRPWDLWLPDGQPQPGTEELVGALDAVLRLDTKHPLALQGPLRPLARAADAEEARRGGGRAETLPGGLEPGRREDPVGVPLPARRVTSAGLQFAGEFSSRPAGSGSPSRMQREKSSRPA
jgi:tetratricopeptide (TPR) repeat protein